VRLLAIAILLVGCAGTPLPPAPHVRLPDRAWTDPWTSHVSTFLFIVESPARYMDVPPHNPLTIRIRLLAASGFPRLHGAERLETIMPTAEGETLWTGILPLHVVINTSRFVHEGYMSVEPTGPTRFLNPLHESCPPSLIRASIASITQDITHVLRTETVGRDEDLGCLYSFLYVPR
jgi:hypothetical protein